MSEENVKLAHRVYDALDRRDRDAFLELMDPKVESFSSIAPVEGHYQGHRGIRNWWRDVFTVFPDFKVEVLEVRDLGEEFVVVHFRRGGHGLDSGTPFEESLWQAARFHQGRVIWWENYRSEAEALEAAKPTG
jgi:ketosteroid isomerase-like protein